MTTFPELTRLLITGLWALAAWTLAHSVFRRRANGLRRLALAIAAAQTVFFLWISLAIPLDWPRSWHNEIARYLDAVTAVLFILWGWLSIKMCEEMRQHGMDC